MLLRRAGHELRNAHSAAAVNLEVVRSRVAAGRAGETGLESFADNAAKGLEEAARLGEGIIALCSAVTTGLGSKSVLARRRDDGSTALEMTMSADSAERVIGGVGALADRIGLGVERTAAGVILCIPPNYETD
jgi:hypothetical protein